MKKILFMIFLACYVSAQYTDGCENPSGKKCIYVATNGNDGNSGTLNSPLRTVQEAVDAINPGDHIVLRDGTYPGCICISPSKNGNSWNSGQYNKMYSYPGEWAIIDGQNSCNQRCGGSGEPGGVLMGNAAWDHTTYSDLKYWWFERLELTRGSGQSDEGIAAAGFWGNGGPFKFRYLYVHDNKAANGGENPGGLKGDHWHDSLVEFCYFKDNGVNNPGEDNNPANLLIYSDYDNSVPSSGFSMGSGAHIYKNEIRYNYFEGSNVGFKHKSTQFLTSRTNFQDSQWDSYGDKIHHNIFYGASEYAIGAHQDFVQVYNNIIDSNGKGILIQYQPGSGEIYKAAVYNNLIKDSSTWDIRRFTDTTPSSHYGWDYNNIIENAGGCPYMECNNECSIAVGACGGGNLNNYYNTDNYFYQPSSTLFNLEQTTYSASGFESQTKSAGPKNVYANSNNPFIGSSGANQYITDGSHVLEGSTTIANGGVGGAHPYLSGVSIPSYVGPTNPNDNAWVAGVMGLRSASALQAMGLDDPGWIEGAGPSDCPNGACDSGETCSSCPSDCSCTGGDICCGTCVSPPNCPNCNDGDSCTTDSCTGLGTCSPTCQNIAVTSCINSDGCCPSSCNSDNDNDCAGCSGAADCPDQQCMTKSCVSSQCVYVAVGCVNNDGCCPTSCSSANDNDCSSSGGSETWGDATGSDHPGTVEDTYVDVGFPTQNFASDADINTYTWPANTAANAIIMKWDLSSIGSATVTGATLHLYMDSYEDTGGDNYYDVSVHKITGVNPVIASCTWNSPWTNGGQSNIATAEDTETVDKTFGYKTWDVTDMVNDWVSGQSNYGMLINSDSTAAVDSNRFFVSSDNSNANQRPKLVIEFSGQTCVHQADNNPCDGVISILELVAYIDQWKTGTVSLTQVMQAITIWKN